jgi:NADPH-dependent curcumin reductase CurA
VRCRQFLLTARPRGIADASVFEFVEVELPALGPGEVLVRNEWLSIDPGLRPLLDERTGHAPSLSLGRPVQGRAVGEVIASRAVGRKVGEHVLHAQGWRDYAIVDAHRARPIDTDLAPARAWLGVLGITGLTAYVGLLDIAELRDGDVVLVSAAAGAVGSIAGQIAKLRGHRVVGSVGSAAKVAHVTGELGFDAAFDYHDGPVADRLAELLPDGVDVYFDNVGGDQLDKAIDALRDFGRVTLCGATAEYNTPGGTRPVVGLLRAIDRRLTLRGFVVYDHFDRFTAFQQDMLGWLADGRVKLTETIVDGLENAPEAFAGLSRGAGVGKLVVRLEHPLR